MNLIEKIWMLWPLLFVITTFMPLQIEISGANIFPPFLILFLIILFFFFIKKQLIEHLKILSFYKYFFLFSLLMLSSLIYTYDDDFQQFLKSFIYGLSWFFMFIVLLVTSNSFFSLKSIYKIINKYILAILILCFFYTFNILRGMDRIEALKFLHDSIYNFNRNDFAMLIIQVVPFTISFFFFEENKLLKIKWFSFTFILLISLGLSGNLGGVIGLIIAFIFASIKFKILSIRRFIGITLIFIIFLLTLLPTIQKRLIIGLKEDPYANITRIVIMKGAVEMLKENWIFGVGTGRYWLKYPIYIDKVEPPIPLPSNLIEAIYNIPRPPHNLYMRIWLEGGFLSIFLYLLYSINFIVEMIKQYKKVVCSKTKPIFLGFTIYGITSFIHSFFYEGYMYPFHFFWMGVGCASIIILVIKKLE